MERPSLPEAARELLGVQRLFDALVKPVPLTPELFRKLQACAYTVTAKVDGVRACLLLLDGEAVLATAQEKLRALAGDWPRCRGLTILDCEATADLVWWFDALVVDGLDVRALPLHDRCSRARDLLSCEGLPLREKPHHPSDSEEGRLLLAEARRPQAGCDGLVFYSALESYGTPPMKFKQTVTCDFLIENARPFSSDQERQALEYRLCIQACNGQLQEWRFNGRVILSRQARRALGLEAEIRAEDRVVIECELQGNRWKPLRRREDRRAPNTAATVTSNVRLCKARTDLSWLVESRAVVRDRDLLTGCWSDFVRACGRALQEPLGQHGVRRVRSSGSFFVSEEELLTKSADGAKESAGKTLYLCGGFGDNFSSFDAFSAFRRDFEASDAELLMIVYWRALELDGDLVSIRCERGSGFGQLLACATPWGVSETFQVDEEPLRQLPLRELFPALPSAQNPHLPSPLAALAARLGIRIFARQSGASFR